MISYAEALSIIAGITPLSASESVPLASAHGRILSHPVHAPIDHPPFTNSAMDGYAFHHASFGQGSLPVAGTVYAALGDQSLDFDATRACVRVMTGAPLPAGTDTVIPVEHTSIEADGRIGLRALPELGANVRHRGADIAQGTELFSGGTYLTPEAILVAASFGLGQLDVRAQPRIALYSTGDELVSPGQALPEGGVYNSTRFFLGAALANLGLKVSEYQEFRDEPGVAAPQIMAFAEKGPALIITTGAVSAGERDFIPSLAQDLGFDTLFHKVAVRPGKPIFLARRQETLWVGIPGNPISTATSWHFFLRPLLTQWLGLHGTEKVMIPVAYDVTKPKDFTCFYRSMVENGQASVFRDQGSANLLASLRANAYIELPEGIDVIPRGSPCAATRLT